MSKANKNTNLNTEELKKYLAGDSTPKQQHLVEKQLLDDAFLNDAAAGFEALKSDGVNVKKSIEDLKNRLSNRIGSQDKKETKVIPLWQKVSIAASIVILLSVGISLLFDSETKESQISTIPIQSAPKSSPEISEMREEATASIPQDRAKKDNLEQPKPTTQLTESSTETLNKSEPIAAIEDKSEAEVVQQASDRVIETPREIKPAAAPPMIEKKKEETVVFKGQVLDSENNPVIGAMVLKKGSNTGFTTDMNGVFRAEDLKIGDVLEVKSIGYVSEEIVVKDTDLGKIKLNDDTQTLSEVVVTGKPKPVQVVKELSQEPVPVSGWNGFDNYLINSLRSTGAVSTLKFDEPLKIRFNVDPSGNPSDIKVDNNISKEQAEKVISLIEKGPKWKPARKKGKKVKKEVTREIKIN